jgi:hypothetical protein
VPPPQAQDRDRDHAQDRDRDRDRRGWRDWERREWHPGHIRYPQTCREWRYEAQYHPRLVIPLRCYRPYPAPYRAP